MAKVAILTKPGRIVVEDRPRPEIGAREVLARVLYAGICGTDLAIYSGEYRVGLPLVLGHEFSGIVEEVGAEVSDEWLGQPVTAEINNTCLSYGVSHPCAACREGLPDHCQKRTVLGILCADGAFQQFLKVPAKNLHRLPDDLDPRVAVFAEPLAAAIQSFELTRLEAGQTVLVLGAGRLGILVTGVAEARGARVLVVSRDKRGLEAARAFGAEETLLADDPRLAQTVRGLTSGLGPPVVVEATGSPEGLRAALDLVAPRGTIALKSTPGAPLEGLDVTRIAVDEIRIQGSRCGPFPKAIDLLWAGTLPVEDLVSSIRPLTSLQEALEAAQEETKVLIDCQA